MKPYPKYKDSGIQWLGKVPEGWEVRKIKHVTSFSVSNVDKKIQEGQFAIRLFNYTDVYNNEFISSDMELMLSSASKEQIDKFSVVAGDVLITKDSEDWRDIAKPALVESSEPNIVCGYHLALIKPHVDKALSRYIFRTLQSSLINQQFQVRSNGVTRYGLPKSAIGESFITVPPKDEQQSIASFLDRETARIDALIGKKERMIELLKEKRIALITQAVTKGLDPSAKMKDSGIEWLGEVPEHWEVKRFDYVCILQRGFDLPHESFVDGDYPVMGSNGVIGYHERYTTQAPNITVGRSGSVGKVNYIESEFWAHNTALFVLSNRNNCMKWLYYLLLNIDMDSVSEGSAVPTLNRNNIHRMMIAVPPVYEQSAIATYLNNQMQHIEQLSYSINNSITLLREYRSSLIHSAVTGKIDLRDYHD